MTVVVAAILLAGTVTVLVRVLGAGSGSQRRSGFDAATRTAAPRSVPADPSGSPTRAPTATSSHSASPSPAPAATSVSSAPATNPAPVAADQQCTNPQFVTSNPTGGWADGGYYVYNDMWNISGYSVQQTLYACSYANWYVVATMNNNSGDGAVKTYPDVHEDFSEPAISSFHSISSTFAETSPHVGIYEDAYDIWINGVANPGSTEVMIWTENHGQVPPGASLATVTVDGKAYQAYKSGSYIAFVADTNFTSGTMDLLAFFRWIINAGWMPASSTLGAIDYGVEIVSTNGAPATFRFTNFSVTTS